MITSNSGKTFLASSVGTFFINGKPALINESANPTF